MRVTQSMLANSNLNYISQNYKRLNSIYDQINTGKKITKPSDDPVVAMKGMRYRSQVVEVDQFRRNLGEGFNWMENADAAMDETNQVLNRIRELTVQASNDSYDPVARKNMVDEISSLQEHIVALANTRIGENYIFNGTDTDKAPMNENLFDVNIEKYQETLGNNTRKAEDYVISYKGQTYQYSDADNAYILKPMVKMADPDGNDIEVPTAELTIAGDGTITHTKRDAIKERDGEIQETVKVISANDLVITDKNAVSTNTESVEIEVMKGVKIPINISSQNAFSPEMFSGLVSLQKMIADPNAKGDDITNALDTIDGYLNDLVSTRAELGAQTNRAEMVDSRLIEQKVIAESTVSNNEDVDFEEAIMALTTQEALHRASLAVGARIIQPTLMDFLR